MICMEAVLDILTLHRRGYSQRAIARKLSHHRQTVKTALADPTGVHRGKPGRPRGSQLDDYEQHIKGWLEEDMGYRATWIYDRLCAIGYTGSYETVKRKVRVLKAEQQQPAYMRFETEPGRQAQVDFGEFQVAQADGSKRVCYLFAMILGYSRDQYVELLDRCDLSTFLDCHIRAFEHFGGVPQEILYDRMKNVYVGRLAGKDRFNDSLTNLALHYGFKPLVAPAYAAWVKGKVERPFDFIREGFWRGYHFVDLRSANKDVQQWMAKKRERIHGTTHERVDVRFERERPTLQSMPVTAFDTSTRLFRPVHKDCTIQVDCNSYVVDHRLVGKEMLVRVKNRCLRIFNGAELVATYAIPEGKGHLVQDHRFYAALKADKTLQERKYGHIRSVPKGRAKQTISPKPTHLELEVETRQISDYETALEQRRTA